MKPINKEKFIQFQEAWGPHFLDRKVCITFLAGFLGTSKSCPVCGVDLDDTTRSRIESGNRATCPNPNCKLRFSYRTTTALEGRALSAEKVCLLLLIMVIGGETWTNSRIGNLCGMSHHSVKKFREQYVDQFK